MKRLVESKKTVKYESIVKKMERKYGMSYELFVRTDQLAKHDYSWRVENDFFTWEMAITELGPRRRHANT